MKTILAHAVTSLVTLILGYVLLNSGIVPLVPESVRVKGMDSDCEVVLQDGAVAVRNSYGSIITSANVGPDFKGPAMFTSEPGAGMTDLVRVGKQRGFPKANAAAGRFD